jgi:hypothetical protein
LQNYVIGCVLKLYTTNALSTISFVLHIDIFEYKEGCFAIVLSGKIIFNDVLLKNVIISYKEEKDDFDTCVLNALKILNEYNE